MLNLEEEFYSEVDIKVVGVGGCGGNALSNMIRLGLDGIEHIAINTDIQALQRCAAPHKIQIGAKITHGLGSGSDPEIGRNSANEDRDVISEALRGADIIFITAGLGGGTGTGAAPVIAEIAREAGALTIAIVIKPFPFEAYRRSLRAEGAIKEIKRKVDTLISISNQSLFSSLDGASITSAFRVADEALFQGVRSISDLITVPGMINLDLADVRTVIAEGGRAALAVGMGRGIDRVQVAVEKAMNSPLLENKNIQGARGVLINITGGEDLIIKEVKEVATAVYEATDTHANVIFGAIVDERKKEEIGVTILATGLKDKDSEEQLSLKFDMEERRSSSQLWRPKQETSMLPLGLFAQDSHSSDEFDIPTFLRWKK
ncbi:cell division protein FtsZ [candidate division NPL-UPA2 bacterium Unc8]|uniref:Cell division protein FtsZ n=1 Tax=candidate division NPL-UPA2 bacterium Unc8 TaxID=1980939 RepID=A0A399FUI4_UNCN2|nr:Cell division protein FtsZ [Bacillota bacterium]MBT9137729.1 Cell division protein FtsZ [Bacillota bacterium]MBT9146818.1 Cell division protein FtsZ [Bacillota bacterium]RIH99753.1 MAG: cell division protein FtsZ [candidate division NPL-UPA2 bacterium Unc8]